MKNQTMELIDRAYSKLKTQQKKMFAKPEIITYNRKTYIINFIDYCASIDRDPEKVKNFLEKDMSASASIMNDNSLNNEKSGLKFSTNFKNQLVMASITNYMKEYVLCQSCKSGNTEINRINKITYIDCNDCKANYCKII